MIPGVTEVEVSLADDSVTDTADQPVDKRAVRATVDEAGASAGVGQRPGPRSAQTFCTAIKAPRKRGATVPARRRALDLRPAARAGRPHLALDIFGRPALVGPILAATAFPSSR
jgi:hypothetical protein